MQKQPTVALIAHDNKKHEMIQWALTNKTALSEFKLCGTGTTAKLVADATGLAVKRYLSGPLGGDQQIGAKVAEGALYDVPIATNKRTADYLIGAITGHIPEK